MKHCFRDMESSACPRRASDADQTAWSYSVTVKEEPEWGECGVSEAAVAEDLYAGHDVKEELVIGPDVVQQQDIAFSMQNGLTRTEKVSCKPKREYGAYAAPECTRTDRGDDPGCNRSAKQQHTLKSCFVRLEQLPLHRSKRLHMSRNCGLSLVACKLERVHCGIEDSRARKAPASYQRRLGKSQLELYSSEVCKDRFRLPSDLIKHKRQHTDQLLYSCDICEKQFKRKFYLIGHILRHTGEKPYSCNICKKRFADKSNLNRHKPIHTGEKLHSCNICNKGFIQKSHLNIHIRAIHTDKKPYHCDICNKQFVEKTRLNRHKHTHTGEKPYTCDICNKRFAQTATLNRHKLVHTDEKPYSCNICNKRFTRQSQLIAHARKHEMKNLAAICRDIKVEYIHT